jgi:hypothetical protein
MRYLVEVRRDCFLVKGCKDVVVESLLHVSYLWLTNS